MSQLLIRQCHGENDKIQNRGPKFVNKMGRKFDQQNFQFFPKILVMGGYMENIIENIGNHRKSSEKIGNHRKSSETIGNHRKRSENTGNDLDPKIPLMPGLI